MPKTKTPEKTSCYYQLIRGDGTKMNVYVTDHKMAALLAIKLQARYEKVEYVNGTTA